MPKFTFSTNFNQQKCNVYNNLFQSNALICQIISNFITFNMSYNQSASIRNPQGKYYC